MIVVAMIYLAQLVGAALLVADHSAGLYVASGAMVAALAFQVTAAWLLVIGGTAEEPRAWDAGT